MKKVLIPTKLDKEVSRILGDAGFAVVQNPEKTVADLAAENTDAEVIIVRSEKVTPEIMDKLPSLRLVVRAQNPGLNPILLLNCLPQTLQPDNTGFCRLAVFDAGGDTFE